MAYRNLLVHVDDTRAAPLVCGPPWISPLRTMRI